MSSNFVRIPHGLAVEPLEVMLNQRMGRIVETPQDFRSWEDKEKIPQPPVLAGTWYPNDKEHVEAFDLRPSSFVEVDIGDDMNRYILVVAAVRKGHDDLAAALLANANDLDTLETLEDILDSLIEKENACRTQELMEAKGFQSCNGGITYLHSATRGTVIEWDCEQAFHVSALCPLRVWQESKVLFLNPIAAATFAVRHIIPKQTPHTTPVEE